MALGRKPQRIQTQEDKTIEINAQMQGSLFFKDPVNLKINGQFNGSLETQGTLTIGNAAQVDANILGDNIVIAGMVNGDITAHVMLVLMPTAVLHGNIKTPKLNVVEGAVFQGRCQMMEEQVRSGDVPGASVPDTEEMLDLTEVAKYLEIDLDEIEALAGSGKIPAVKSGKAWKFDRAQIDNWLASARMK